MAVATFAAGCFWGVEARFADLPGVMVHRGRLHRRHDADPTYESVCSHKTGHAEAVRLEFDPETISYEQLLEAFFAHARPDHAQPAGPRRRHPVPLGDLLPRRGAGADGACGGRQAEERGRCKAPIVTEIVPAGEFYRAEEYHQKYLEKHGRGSCAVWSAGPAGVPPVRRGGVSHRCRGGDGWWATLESNQRPLACRASALPSELVAHGSESIPNGRGLAAALAARQRGAARTPAGRPSSVPQFVGEQLHQQRVSQVPSSSRS